eukprot:g9201.t1
MNSTRFSGANVYKSRAYQMNYPCYSYGYSWRGSFNPSFSSWNWDSTNEWYSSCHSGSDYEGNGIASGPWDMNSLKTALCAARTGTREVANIIMSCDFDPREAAFTKLISACGMWKDSKKAIEVFQAMTEKRDIRPNTITYTALISACSSSGDSVAAMEVFKNMKIAAMTDPNCCPNDVSSATLLSFKLRMYVTYNKIITASECGGFHKFAVNCFQEMKDQGIEGDRAVYCSALHSCIQLQSWNEAETVLSIMHGKGFATSLANYAVMINYYGEMGQMENAANLFIELQELDQKVDQQCCHALMRAFELAENDDMAMDLVYSMWDTEISVEMPTYISALRIFALKGKWRKSLKILKRMAIDGNSIPEEAKELILKAARSSDNEIVVKKLEDVFNNDTVEGASSSSSSD